MVRIISDYIQAVKHITIYGKTFSEKQHDMKNGTRERLARSSKVKKYNA